MLHFCALNFCKDVRVTGRWRFSACIAVGWILLSATLWSDRAQGQTDDTSTCLRLSDLSVGTGDSVLFDNVATALTRAGICLERLRVPASRGTQMLLHGELDGEMLRVSSYVGLVGEVAFPVEEPVYRYTGSVITDDPEITAAADLVGRPVAAIRGLRWSDRVITEEGLDQVIPVDNGDQLRDLLLRDRVDAILWGGPGLARAEELAAFRKIPVYHTTLHIYLRKEHRSWAPAIEDALRQYNADGFVFDGENGILPRNVEAEEGETVLSN